MTARQLARISRRAFKSDLAWRWHRWYERHYVSEGWADGPCFYVANSLYHFDKKRGDLRLIQFAGGEHIVYRLDGLLIDGYGVYQKSRTSRPLSESLYYPYFRDARPPRLLVAALRAAAEP